MRLPSGHSRPLRVTLSGWAVALVCLLGSTGTAADVPADLNRFPPWFREFVDSVRTNSADARAKAEAKLAEGRAAGDRTTEAYALLAVSTARRLQNDIPGAIALSREALALGDVLPNDLLKYNLHYIHGLNLNAHGDTAGAIESFLRSLHYADARQSARTRSTTLAALASAYTKLNDLERAYTYEREALAIAESLGDERAIGMYSSNLAGLEEERGNRAAVRPLLERALAIKRAEGGRTEIADLEERLIMLDFAEGKVAESLAALDPILAQRRTLRGKVKLTQTLLNRAKILLRLNRADEALTHVEEARGYVESIEARNLRRSVYARLAEVQEARGDFAAALAAARREFAEREAMAGEAAKARVAELQTQFDVAKKDAELARLARENEARAAEKRVQDAQLARQAAELRAHTAELRAKDAELAHTRLTRYLLGTGLGAAVVGLAALLAFQRLRLRHEQRLLAETRRARDAAMEADRVKTRFLGIASHDIRAPLGNILNLTDALRTDHAAGPPPPDLDLITAEAQRVLGLVEDLLTTTSLDAGKLSLRSAPTDLADITHAVVGGLRWQARAKQQALVFDTPAADAGRCEGDAARLYQAVANLVTNAIKFSPPGSTITLRLTRNAPHLLLSVQDQGPGVAASDVPKLFAPFEQRTATPTGRESSHGLGLSIAHEIITLHGGTIRVESTPGHGATFIIDLPVTA